MTVRQFGLGALAALVVSLALPVSARAEQVENPEYKMWSGFKPGSSVTMKMVSEAAGNTTEMEMTHTLVEVNGDKAVVETKTKMVVAGNTMDMPAQKRDIPAKVDKVEGQEPEKKPEVKESKESIEVGGQKVDCKKTETTSEANGMTMHATVWMCEQIPGHMAKMESTSEGQMSSKTSMVAVKWEAKK